MKIAFCSLDPYWRGICDNGGSRTILRSAETLRKMGHRVDVVCKKDTFTWFDHPKCLRKIPKDVDVSIAIAVTDIPHLMRKGHGKLAYWARPFESWQLPTHGCKRILKDFHKHGGTIMCNSTWQKDWMAERGIPATVVFNGLDFDEWEDRGMRGTKKTIGCLYHLHPRKRWKDFKKLRKLLGKEFNYAAYGACKPKSTTWGRFYKNPSHGTLVSLYSSCDIWFAPSVLEGFHNPPYESNLCGCLVCRPVLDSCGSGDAAHDGTALVYSSIRDAAKQIREADYGLVPLMQNVIAEKIGTREKNMQILIETLTKGAS